MTFYRTIIKDSWRATWRNPYLWFFGLFAAILGNGGEYEVFSRSTSATSDGILSGVFSGIWMLLSNLPLLFKRFWESPLDVSMILFAYFLFLLAFLFVVWLINASVAAIVDSNVRQKKEKDHDLRTCLSAGVKNFWPVLAANMSVKILILLSIAAFALFSNFWIKLLLFMVLLPALIVISFISKYTIAYVIARGYKLKEAFESGVKLFKGNWLISLELALILYLCTFLAGIVFIFLTFNINKFFEVLSGFFPASTFAFLWIIMPLTLLAILAFIGAVLAAFQISAWTRLFVELESRGGVSKIERIFGRS